MEPPSNGGIFDAQVAPLKQLGYRTVVFFPMFAITRDFKLNLITAGDYAESVFDIRIPIPAFSFMGVPGALSFFWLVFVMAFVRLWRLDFFAEVDEVRVRNIVFPAVCRFVRLKIDVTDVRGILHDEASLLGRSRFTAKFIYFLEGFAVRNSKRMTAPTRSVAAYLRMRNPGCTVGLLEPFVISDRFKLVQRSLPAGKGLKAVYLGSLAPWNDCRRISAVFQGCSIIEKIQFVGSYSPAIEDYIRMSCDGNCEVDFIRVAHEEVYELLRTFDVGLLLGSRSVSSLTDRTMVPSKLYEYVEAGLTPLIPAKCKAARTYLKKSGVSYIEY